MSEGEQIGFTKTASQRTEDVYAQQKTENQAGKDVPDHFYSHGIGAVRLPLETHIREGETILGQVIDTPDGQCTSIHFLPGDRLTNERSAVTESLFLAVQGMQELVAAVERGRVNLPPVLVGETNPEMANIARRIGFEPVDSCTANGKIDPSKPKIVLVGRFEEVKEKLKKFLESDIYTKIQDRYRKYNPDNIQKKTNEEEESKNNKKNKGDKEDPESDGGITTKPKDPNPITPPPTTSGSKTKENTSDQEINEDLQFLKELLGISADAPKNENEQEKIPEWLEEINICVTSIRNLTAREVVEKNLTRAYVTEFKPYRTFGQKLLKAMRKSGVFIDNLSQEQWQELALKAGVTETYLHKPEYIVYESGIARNPDYERHYDNISLGNEEPYQQRQVVETLDALIQYTAIKKGKELEGYEEHLMALCKKIAIPGNLVREYLTSEYRARSLKGEVVFPETKTSPDPSSLLPEKPSYEYPPPRTDMLLNFPSKFLNSLDQKAISEGFKTEKDLKPEDFLPAFYTDMRKINELLKAGCAVHYINPANKQRMIFLPHEIPEGEKITIDDGSFLIRRGKGYEIKVKKISEEQNITFKVLHTLEIPEEMLEEVVCREITAPVTPNRDGISPWILYDEVYGPPLSQHTEAVKTEEGKAEEPQDQGVTVKNRSIRTYQDWKKLVQELRDNPPPINPEYQEPEIPFWKRALGVGWKTEEQEIGQPQPPYTDYEYEEATRLGKKPYEIRSEQGLPWEYMSEEEKESWWEKSHRIQDETRAKMRERQQIGWHAKEVLKTLGCVYGKASKIFEPRTGNLNPNAQTEYEEGANPSSTEYLETEDLPILDLAEQLDQIESLYDGMSIPEQVESLLSIENKVESLDPKEISQELNIPQEEVQEEIESLAQTLKDTSIPIRERIRQIGRFLTKISGHSRSRYDYSPIEEETYNQDEYDDKGTESQPSQQKQQTAYDSSQNYGYEYQETSYYYDEVSEQPNKPKQEPRVRVADSAKDMKGKNKWNKNLSDIQAAFYTEYGRMLKKTDPERASQWIETLNRAREGYLSDGDQEIINDMRTALRLEEKLVEARMRSDTRVSSYGLIMED